MYRVALAGVGGFGGNFVNALLNPPPEMEVVFAAGVDPYARLSPTLEYLEKSRIPVFSDLGEFLSQERVDVVVISTPIHLHAPQTMLALGHQAAVLCEKPLSATLEDGLAMLNAERQSGLPVGIGYQWSFSKAVQQLKSDIQAGVLGRPKRLKTMVLWPRRRSYYQRNSWAGRIRMPSGEWVLDSPVNNATAHYLHNMFFVLGSQFNTSAFPKQVQAEVYCANEIENFDSVALRVWTEEDVEILFYTTHPVPDEIGPVMEFEFEKGVVTYRSADQPEFIAKFKDGTIRNYGNPNEGHTQKLWYFLENLKTGSLPACGIMAAMSQTLTVYGLHKSVPQPVRFPDHMVRRELFDNDYLIWVDGLAEEFQEAYARGVLPSDLTQSTWVSPGGEIDLRSELDRIAHA